MKSRGARTTTLANLTRSEVSSKRSAKLFPSTLAASGSMSATKFKQLPRGQTSSAENPDSDLSDEARGTVTDIKSEVQKLTKTEIAQLMKHELLCKRGD